MVAEPRAGTDRPGCPFQWRQRSPNAPVCERERNHGCASLAFVPEACTSDSVCVTMQPMECKHCKRELPPGSSARKMFCDDSHRASYWRGQSALSPKRKRSKEQGDTNVRARPPTQRVRHHTTPHSVHRMPMAEQLAKLAPEGALGYRLVLPTRTPDDMPRLSPPLDATGYQGHYSLRPFQAPYDIRLMEGQTYRVVWTGASGEIVPPKANGTIPGLHFFLTSSDSSVQTEAESTSGDSASTAQTEPLQTASRASANKTEVDAQCNVTPIELTEIPKLARDLGPLVKELDAACREFAAWHRSDRGQSKSSPRDVLDPKQIAHYLTLTERLTEALRGRPLQMFVIEILCTGRLMHWMHAILVFLCQNERPTDALTLYEKLLSTLGEKPTELIIPRIELLLCARQFQDARLLAEQMLAVSPLDLNLLTAAATASQECGDYNSAESYLRRQYQTALDSFRIDLFVDTVEQLIAVLGKLGKEEECGRLNQMFGDNGFLAHGRRLMAEATPEPESSTSEPLPSSPPAVVAPPPSRNQPCPCKSGKRYRHCCRPKGPQSAVSSAGSTK